MVTKSNCCKKPLEIYWEKRHRKWQDSYVHCQRWRCSKCKRFHGRPPSFAIRHEYRPVTIPSTRRSEMKKMLFPNEVKKIMQKIGITTEEEEALCEFLSENFISKPSNMNKIKLKLKEIMSTR